LPDGGILTVEMHHHVQFRQNHQVIHCRDIVFLGFNMAAIRHIGFVWGTFGPPTKGTSWSLSLYKIWLQSCNTFANTKVSHGWFENIHHHRVACPVADVAVPTSFLHVCDRRLAHRNHLSWKVAASEIFSEILPSQARSRNFAYGSN